MYQTEAYIGTAKRHSKLSHMQFQKHMFCQKNYKIAFTHFVQNLKISHTLLHKFTKTNANKHINDITKVIMCNSHTFTPIKIQNKRYEHIMGAKKHVKVLVEF